MGNNNDHRIKSTFTFERTSEMLSSLSPLIGIYSSSAAAEVNSMQLRMIIMAKEEEEEEETWWPAINLHLFTRSSHHHLCYVFLSIHVREIDKPMDTRAVKLPAELYSSYLSLHHWPSSVDLFFIATIVGANKRPNLPFNPTRVGPSQPPRVVEQI